MAKNYMREFAKMADVEFGERFKLLFSDGSVSDEKYYLDKDGLKDDKGNSLGLVELGMLVKGMYEIVKLMWKPKDGEEYWFIIAGGECVGSNEFVSFKWSNDMYDLQRYKCGNCFKTAEEITPEVIERYKAFLNNGERIEW